VKIDGEDKVYGYIENDFESVDQSYFSFGIESQDKDDLENQPYIYDEEAVKKLSEISLFIKD